MDAYEVKGSEGTGRVERLGFWGLVGEEGLYEIH